MGQRHAFLHTARRSMLGLGLLLLASLVLGRFLPPPSTLMLGRWLTGQPVMRIWVPLEKIAPHLPRAIIAAEDQRFCTHWGVDFIELRTVLDDEDGPSRGASTLSMQLAKNLYLWPGRSYLRKALEMPLALALDLAWGKRRSMEVYLNIAEWGEGVFGAEAAARHYFSKSARDLSPAEAARLTASLPNPALRDAGEPSAAARRIAMRAARLGAHAACVS